MGHMGRARKPIPESAFTKWFCKLLESVNTKVLPIVGGQMQPAGIPDRYVCHSRFRGWLEFKRLDRRLELLQKKFAEDFNQRGDTVLIVRLAQNEMILYEDSEGKALVVRDRVTIEVKARHDKAAAGRMLLDDLVRAKSRLLYQY